MGLRTHQQQAVSYAQEILEGTADNDILAWIVPGGGKSWLPPLMLNELGDDWQLAWFVPRLNLAAQAEEDTLKKFDLTIRKSGNDPQPARDTRGFVTTHQSLEKNPELWHDAMSDGRKWLLFFDEMSHAYINSNGQYSPTARALADLPYSARVLMTGTMERAERTQRIYGVNYVTARNGYKINMDNVSIRYDRKTALLESEGPALVPVWFEHHDGPVKWDNLNTNIEEEYQLSKVRKEDEGIGALTAVQTGLGRELLNRGLSDWSSRSDGKAIVVCARQTDAKKWLKDANNYGEACIAISEDSEAAQETIKLFRRNDGPRILVTVAMAYEGLDVPDITHGICLTHYRSAPWIEQMLGRAWRKIDGKDKCYWWMPDDPAMNRVIEKIKKEQPSDVIIPGDGPGGGNNGETRVPLSSTFTTKRLSGLDGDVSSSDFDTVSSMLASFGLSNLIEQAKESMLNRKNDRDTQSEKEKKYRRELWNEIVRVNKQYDLDFGDVGWRLNKKMGAKADTATITQLRKGIKYANDKWPNIDS